MGLQYSNSDFNKVLQLLGQDYKIFAPVRLLKRGRFSDTDLIRYSEITTG